MHKVWHVQTATVSSCDADLRRICCPCCSRVYRYDGAGAVWDIVRRKEVAAVDYFLSSNAKEFIHQGAPVNPSTCSAASKYPVLSQHFMLVESHRQKLKTFFPERPVEMLHFEQHLDEGVYIPGGCPHQVRNLQSCTKVRTAW